VAVLPCGVDLSRFRPLPRTEARRRLGLDPFGRYLLFPADPARRVKRHDRALEVARRAGAELLVTSEVDPGRMPDYVNAAAAVLVTSDNEGFGLAALEGLACRVPVLSTPVGIAPLALADIDGCLLGRFEAEAWTRVVRRHLEREDPRVDPGETPSLFSAERMAERVLTAYRAVLEPSDAVPG
jgi:glycosyltransferase involved in cell wall biosynthesis